MKNLYLIFAMFFLVSCGEAAPDLPPPPTTDFVSTWRTTTPNETITLPLRDGYNYDFTVDWGDGTSNAVTSDADLDKTHEYAEEGTHTIRISGTMEAFYFNDEGDKEKIYTVENLGDVSWVSLESAFKGCSNITKFIGQGNTSRVTNMAGMFFKASSLTSLDLSNFNTSRVTNMAYMFFKASSLTSLDLSNFNTSRVINMKYMFALASSLTSLDLSNFNTSRVTNMYDMFAWASSLTSLDLSNFNTSRVTNMYGMFFEASSLTSLDLSNFNTSRVTDMDYMFT